MKKKKKYIHLKILIAEYLIIYIGLSFWGNKGDFAVCFSNSSLKCFLVTFSSMTAEVIRPQEFFTSKNSLRIRLRDYWAFSLSLTKKCIYIIYWNIPNLWDTAIIWWTYGMWHKTSGKGALKAQTKHYQTMNYHSFQCTSSRKQSPHSYYLLVKLTTKYVSINPFIISHYQLGRKDMFCCRNTEFKEKCVFVNTLVCPESKLLYVTCMP